MFMFCVLEEIDEPDVVCWSFMIDASARSGECGACYGGAVQDADLGLGTATRFLWKIGSESEMATCNALSSRWN